MYTASNYLFHDAPPAALCSAITLERLSQERVERFGYPSLGGGLCVHGAGKGSHVSQFVYSGIAGDGLVERICVDEVLHHSLQEGEGLVDAHLQIERRGGKVVKCDKFILREFS